MIANFKRNNKLIITGADRAESLIIQQLVEESKKENKKLSLTEFYDVDGEVNGLSIDLEEVEEIKSEDKEQQQ